MALAPALGHDDLVCRLAAAAAAQRGDGSGGGDGAPGRPDRPAGVATDDSGGGGGSGRAGAGEEPPVVHAPATVGGEGAGDAAAAAADDDAPGGGTPAVVSTAVPAAATAAAAATVAAAAAPTAARMPAAALGGATAPLPVGGGGAPAAPPLPLPLLVGIATPGASPPAADVGAADPEELRPQSGSVGRRRLDSFDMVSLLGAGGFGKVYLVRHKASGQVYALKVMQKKAVLRRKDVKAAHTERNILAMLTSSPVRGDNAPFIVRLHCCWQCPRRLYLLMDYAAGGELLHHLRRERMLSEAAARFYLAEMVLALEHLQARHVIHRDLKPSNLLLDSAGHIVLCDFGLSTVLLDGASRTHSWCGTEDFLAPEVVARDGHGVEADWFSLGGIAFEMMTGEPPFSPASERHLARKELHRRILRCKPKLPRYLTRDAHALLKALLMRDPAARLTDPAAVKRHPFFRGMDWEALAARQLPPPITPLSTGSPTCTSNFSPRWTGKALSPLAASPLVLSATMPVAVPGRAPPLGPLALDGGGGDGDSPDAAAAAAAASAAAAAAAAAASAAELFKGFSFVAPGLELDLRVPSDSAHGTDEDGAGPSGPEEDYGDALGGCHGSGGGGEGLSALAGRLGGRGPGLAAMGFLSPALSASPPLSSGAGRGGEELVADAALLAVDAVDAVEIF